MKIQSLAVGMLSFLSLTGSLSVVNSHGLMEDPPSRNQFCGVLTKPHEVVNGNSGAAYPQCKPAFDNDFNGGYQFMSVLTHDIGRVGGRSTHVCGFDSETWQGGASPWDTPMDWPTTPMTPGRNSIKWNIEWGPHFSDTEEFRYWITKPGFVFDPTQELSWDDFEENAFCVQFYSDTDPSANPDVIPNVGSTEFQTFCDVPARSGRHVIYGEWGRNEWTFERFHGCIDAVFDGAPAPPTTGMVPPVTTPTTTTAPYQAPVSTAPVFAPTALSPVPVNANCKVSIRSGRNAWYAGLDIGFDSASVVLDFGGTGLDLNTVTLDTSTFNAEVIGQTIFLTKPQWVSSTVVGNLGINGNNVASLATFADPVCLAGRRTI